MKRIIKRIFSVGVCLLAGVSFGFLGFLYISSQNSEPVKKTESEIPYSYVPDNAGVMFEFYEEKIYAHLDFENEKISLIFASTPSFQSSTSSSRIKAATLGFITPK